MTSISRWGLGAAFDHQAGIANNGDGGFAVSGSEDGYVYVWAVPTKNDVATHRLPATRLPRLSHAWGQRWRADRQA